MYKDKDKQRKAVREATRRYRAKRPIRQGLIRNREEQGITVSQEEMVIPRRDTVIEGPGIKPQSHNPMMIGYVPPKEGL